MNVSTPRWMRSGKIRMPKTNLTIQINDVGEMWAVSIVDRVFRTINDTGHPTEFHVSYDKIGLDDKEHEDEMTARDILESHGVSQEEIRCIITDLKNHGYGKVEK